MERFKIKFSAKHIMNPFYFSQGNMRKINGRNGEYNHFSFNKIQY